MTTRIGFIKGVLGLAFTASVAIRGTAQDKAFDTARTKHADAEAEDFFTSQARYVAMAVDQLAWQMDVTAKYNASRGRKPLAGIPSDETDMFVEWVKENQ